MTNAAQPIDPSTVNWAKVRSGEIEAPPRIVPPERDENGHRPLEDGVLWIWDDGELGYYDDGAGFETPHAAAEYSNDGVLLRTNTPEPVLWESVEDWSNPPMLVCEPSDAREIFHKLDRIAHTPEWWRGWEYFHEDEWERKTRLRGGDSCVRYDACYQRIDDTDRFRLIWKRGDDKSPANREQAPKGGEECVEDSTPKLGPYPEKCLHCDWLTDLGHALKCPVSLEALRKRCRHGIPLNAVSITCAACDGASDFATTEPVGATWEKFRI